jgi:hypothetical protein
MTGLEEHFWEAEREAAEQINSEICEIASSPDAEGDTVYVKFPNSEHPDGKVKVDYWRVGVTLVGGVLQPRLPQRGQPGVALHLDTGEIWLIH